MHSTQQKEAMRDAALRRVKAMTLDERTAESKSVCKHTLHHYPNPKGVCAYFPLKTEVNITFLLQEYLQNNVPVYLPSFSGNSFTFRKIKDLESVKPGDLTIPEPPKNAPELQLADVDIVLVPGRAFNAKHKLRLGRGNGGYDKWIANLPTERPKLIGVCFECQLFPEVPTEPHDQPLDEVMTARKLYW